MTDVFDEYFITSYQGQIIETFTITLAHGYQNIFSCRVCFALTVEPEAHVEWHEEVLNAEGTPSVPAPATGAVHGPEDR